MVVALIFVSHFSETKLDISILMRLNEFFSFMHSAERPILI